MRIKPLDLQKEFDYVNKTYFDGKLPPVPVKWGNLIGGRKAADGCIESDGTIVIDNLLKYRPRLAAITVRHEMVHLSLPEYFGCIPDKDHGMLFQAGIFRLINMGAYDGLL